jgi:hypothetical protein
VALVLGIWRHRIIAPPIAAVRAEAAATSPDALAPLIAEARREVG